MTNSTVANDGVSRIKDALKGLIEYQEIIELASEQLEAKKYLRVSILLDEYRSMAEYFLDEIEAAIKFSESHNLENLSLGTSDAIAKCAHPESAYKPAHNPTPTDGQAD